MKKYKLILILQIFLFTESSFAQITESFSNFTVGSKEVKTGEFMGDNNVTWTYTNCRGDNDRQAVYTTNYKGFKSVAQQFSQNGCQVTKTNEYVAPPKGVTTKEWHLKASYSSSLNNRILTLIQVVPDGATSSSIIKLGEGDFQFGDWCIKAELNGNNPVSLYIRNNAKDVTFSLGQDNPIINGEVYQRQTPGSTILFDEIDQTKKTVEMVDRPAQATR